MNDAWWSKPCPTPNADAAHAALARQGALTKPQGSLGVLEDIAVWCAAWQGTDRPGIERVWISVFAADHGVAAEGVSAFPQAVTGEMVRNFATGGAAIAVIARRLDARLDVVNLGTVNDPGDIPEVHRAVIAPSTANFCEASAMTREQLRDAMQVGADRVALALDHDADIFIGGEMGIGNTTAATALACALLGHAPEALAGAGTGLDAAGIEHKCEVVRRALALHADADDAFDTLRRVGGFEIAALVGAYVAAAQSRLPVLVDGFITTVAALAAVRLNEGVRDWLCFAHRSQERGHARVLDAMGARPILDLGMRLGEASGAAIAVPLLRMACVLHREMATFEQAGVSGG